MNDLEANLRSAFQAANERQSAAIDDILQLYHEDVYFEDPLQRLYGKQALARALRNMYRMLGTIEFQIQSFSLRGDEAHLTWMMCFRPPLGPLLRIEAASLIKVRDGRIVYHRDYWDLLSSLANACPFLARIYRGLSRRWT
ncbi:MAG: nuclear transport factor 2 family protein [Myxococcales bacterium]|nr:nuclear transport factor 2 family protein [Polyangiaceae bacterium]MDW8249806.1 nuclear transport factor 2 family protein [Myxococcales bacterium]